MRLVRHEALGASDISFYCMLVVAAAPSAVRSQFTRRHTTHPALLPCGNNWTCSPITSRRWDHEPFTAPAQQAEEVSAQAAAMRVGLARAVRLAVRNEFGSNAKSVPGVLPAAMAAAFRRQKAQRVQLGAFWCRTAVALREPCAGWLSAEQLLLADTATARRQEAHRKYCAHVSRAHLGPTGGFCMAEVDAARPLEHFRRASSMNSCINPFLARGLSSLFGATSRVADVGAGVGGYGMFMRLLNPRSPPVASLDGAENIEAWSGDRVEFFDVSSAADVQGVEPVEWVMSIEMAEHVPRSLEAAVVANLHWLNTKGIVLTWALPGQPGSGHINGRSNRYVHSLLHQLGYTRDAVEEAKLRLNVNRYRLAGSAEEKSVLSWRANQSELHPPLSRERAWVRKSVASVTAPDGIDGRGGGRAKLHASSGAAQAMQLKTMVDWLGLCPWLGDTLMVYRRPADASAQQLPPGSPSSSHGGAGAARVKAALVEARSEVVARARLHLCSRQRALRKLAARARFEFGQHFAVLNEHLSTNEDAVRKLRLGVESHLRAFDQLARELRPEALAGCPREADETRSG